MYEAASQIRLGIEPYLEIRSAKSPAVAPDGELLAYLSDESGTHQIWLRPLAGGAPWRLTDMPEPVGSIAFNPKSRDLLFTMDCGGDERAGELTFCWGRRWHRKLLSIEANG